MQLETERLILRRPRHDDVDALAATFGDPEVMRYIGSGRTATRDDVVRSVDAMLERHEADGFGMLVVERREDGRLVGRCGLLVWDAETWTPSTLRDARSPEIEAGWTLGREFWGSGYATEAALAVRDFALHELGRRRLISLIHPANVRSIRVAEKLGMSYERDVPLLRPTRLYALVAAGNEPAR